MVTGLMTHSIQKPNYIRPIILLGRPVRNYTAKSAAGLINIMTIPMSTNSIRAVTPPSKTLIWITTCGNGGLMKSGLLVSALIFVSSTPQYLASSIQDDIYKSDFLMRLFFGTLLSNQEIIKAVKQEIERKNEKIDQLTTNYKKWEKMG